MYKNNYFSYSHLSSSDDYFVPMRTTYIVDSSTNPIIIHSKSDNESKNGISINNLVGLLEKYFGHYNKLDMEKKIFDVVVSLLLQHISVVNHEGIEIEIAIDYLSVHYPNAQSTYSSELLFIEYDIDHSVYNKNGERCSIFEPITQDFKHAEFLKFLKEHVNYIDEHTSTYSASELYDAYQSYVEMMKHISDE